MEMKKQRNCYIEFLRFVFTLLVVIAHYNGYFQNNVLKGRWNGHIGVEFFFVLSGFLLAAYCAKNAGKEPVHQATWTYIKRKALGLAPVYYVVLAYFVVRTLVIKKYTGLYLINFILQLMASLFFLPSMGLVQSVAIPYGWYIGGMMLGIFILFPFVYRWQKGFTQMVAPLIVFIFCTWAMQVHGKLYMLQSEWMGLCFPSTVRAIGDLCMGIFAYEICEFLKNKFSGQLTEVGRLLFTITNVGMFVMVVYLVVVGLAGNVHPTVLLMFAFGVAITFSGIDYTEKLNRIPIASKICSGGGALSLSLYLGQGIVINRFPEAYTLQQHGIYVYVLLCIIVAMIIYALSKAAGYFMRYLKKGFASVCIKS